MTYGEPPTFEPPPPYGALPYAGPSRRRDRILLAVSGFLVVVVVAGGLAAILWRDTKSRPPHPKEWDPRVLDIVKFDEQHRGLTFKEPVFVDFLDAKAYSERVRTEQSKLTDKEKQQLSAFQGELRALGLSNSTGDLGEALNKLVDVGTLAFYDPETQRVTIRGTEITVDLRVTLAHEFTHVLQDQYFGVGKGRTDKFTTSQEQTSFRALVEGDAVRIENEYIAALSARDKAEYDQTHQKAVDTATTGLADVPIALQALQAAPYLLGPPFVELLDADGKQAEVDQAFRKPPATDEQVMEAPAFLRHESALEVDEPALPDGVTKDNVIDSGDFGATSWLLVLAERIDPLVALRAVDGWGGDAYVAYEQNGTTCVRIAWQGDTDADHLAMQDALNQWVAAMPAGAASVTPQGAVLLMQACDPDAGVSITVNNRAIDVLQLPSARSQFMLEAVRQLSFTIDKAFAFGDCVVHSLSFDQFKAADRPAIQSAVVACRDKPS
ncbi:MAG: hypothetical protein QOC92_2804 [Acidimicrobiaceae bacterium]|jgi:hypothetical protein